MVYTCAVKNCNNTMRKLQPCEKVNVPCMDVRDPLNYAPAPMNHSGKHLLLSHISLCQNCSKLI